MSRSVVSRSVVDPGVVRDLSWWHWALTVPLLVAYLGGAAWALPAAMALCTALGTYFLLRLGSLRPYPVQVRWAYLALLALGTLPYMAWIHWIQLAGTSAMVVGGYCPLIRLLSLAPWNRTTPFSRASVWHAFVEEPCAGGLLCGRWPQHPGTLACTLPLESEQALSCSAVKRPAPRVEAAARGAAKERVADRT